MQYGYLQSKQKPVVLGAVHRPLFCAWESGAVCLSAPSCPSWLPPDPFCLSLPSAQGSTFTLTCLLTCTACSISEIPGPFSRMSVLLLPQDLCTLHKLFHVFSVSSSIPQPGQIRELTHFLPVHSGVHAHTRTQQFWKNLHIWGNIDLSGATLHITDKMEAWPQFPLFVPQARTWDEGVRPCVSDLNFPFLG